MPDLPTITLSRAVRKNGKDITELPLQREPTIGDIAKHGEPFRLVPNDSGGATVTIASETIIRIAAECFAIPPSELHKLPAGDYQTIQNALIPFFAPPDAPDQNPPETESNG